VYAFEKGDKIIISATVEKDKDINEVKFEVNGNILFSSTKVSSFENKEFIMPETNFLNLNFWGPNMGSRDFELKIERIPASPEGKFFNTAIQEYKSYDTTYVTYEIDSVIGYEEIRTPKTFRVIEDCEYQGIQMKAEKFKIYGGKTNSLMVIKPEAKIITDTADLEFLGYHILITSAAGADAMWNAIGIGVDVASLAMNFVLPPGAGVAAGLGLKTAFEMIGPQEGGEPVYYAVMNNEDDAKKFKNSDYKVQATAKAFEFGLATNYSGNWWAMDTLVVGLKNLNVAVEIEVSVVISAVYQKTLYKTISQDIVTIRPKTVKVPRTREVITNNKYWNNQN
jgi:hypothetical protein